LVATRKLQTTTPDGMKRERRLRPNPPTQQNWCVNPSRVVEVSGRLILTS
jgi:hypothetical protein